MASGKKSKNRTSKSRHKAEQKNKHLQIHKSESHASVPLGHCNTTDFTFNRNQRTPGRRPTATPTPIQVPQDLKDSPSYVQSEKAKRKRDSLISQPSFSSASGSKSAVESKININHAQQDVIEWEKENESGTHDRDEKKSKGEQRKVEHEKDKENHEPKNHPSKTDHNSNSSNDADSSSSLSSSSSSSSASTGSASQPRTSPHATNPLKRKLFDPSPQSPPLPPSPPIRHSTQPTPCPIAGTKTDIQQLKSISLSPSTVLHFQTALTDLATVLPATYLTQAYRYILDQSPTPHFPSLNQLPEDHPITYAQAATSTIQAARVVIRDLSVKHSMSGSTGVIEELKRIVREKEMRIKQLEGEVSGLKWQGQKG